MFLGRYTHTIDEKGRLTIPSRFRELLADGGYLTEGMEGNLQVLPAPIFEKYFKGITNIPFINMAANDLRLKVFASAAAIEFDKAGRILIPQHLREFAQLSENAVITGTGDGFSIWTPELWKQKQEQLANPKIYEEGFKSLNLSI